MRTRVACALLALAMSCDGYYYDDNAGEYVNCCKVCGTTSQACGDSCISNDFECSQPPGCACEGAEE